MSTQSDIGRQGPVSKGKESPGEVKAHKKRDGPAVIDELIND